MFGGGGGAFDFFLERICFLAGDSEIMVNEFGTGGDDERSSVSVASSYLLFEERPTSRKSGSDP